MFECRMVTWFFGRKWVRSERLLWNLDEDLTTPLNRPLPPPVPGTAVMSGVRAEPAPVVPTLPVVAAVGAIGVLTTSLVVSKYLLDAIVGFGWPVVVYVALLIAVAYGPSVWWCRFASRRWGTDDLGADIGLRPQWSDLGWGPVVWLGALGAQIAAGVGRGRTGSSDLEQHRSDPGGRCRPRVRRRVGDRSRGRRSDRRGDGLPGGRPAGPEQPPADRPGDPAAGSAVRRRPHRSRPRCRQHRPGVGAVRRRDRVRDRGSPVATNRPDHRGPRTLQRSRADRGADRRRRSATGRRGRTGPRCRSGGRHRCSRRWPVDSSRVGSGRCRDRSRR